MGIFSLIGGIIGGNKQAKASREAARLQNEATRQGIAESARQYDQTRTDFQPFRDAGVTALGGLGDLIGLGGVDAQGAAIDSLRGSPMFQRRYDAGQESILASAAATGGLRGGNTQASLYDLGEGTLDGLIRQQIADYGGLVGIGTGATDAVAGYGAQAVAAQNNLRNQGAAANAQARLVRGGIAAQNWMNAGSMIEDSLKSAMVPGGGFSWGKLF